MDEAQPSRERGIRMAEFKRLTVHCRHGPLVWLVVAGEDLDERGLAAAIRPHQRTDLAGVHLEVDRPQSLLAGEGLRETFDRQDNG